MWTISHQWFSKSGLWSRSGLNSKSENQSSQQPIRYIRNTMTRCNEVYENYFEKKFLFLSIKRSFCKIKQVFKFLWRIAILAWDLDLTLTTLTDANNKCLTNEHLDQFLATTTFSAFRFRQLIEGRQWHFSQQKLYSDCLRAPRTMTSIILMLQRLVLLYFQFSLFDLFILVWKQKHFICWSMKSSSVNQIKVKMSYQTTQSTLRCTVKRWSCFGSQANSCSRTAVISFGCKWWKQI